MGTVINVSMDLWIKPKGLGLGLLVCVVLLTHSSVHLSDLISFANKQKLRSPCFFWRPRINFTETGEAISKKAIDLVKGGK